MSTKKHAQPQNSSLSSFTNPTQNSQITKKAISTEQISLQSSHSHHKETSSSLSSSTSSSAISASNINNSLRHHNIVLPFEINIKSLIKHLLIKLEENGITVLYRDEDEGEVLVQRGKGRRWYEGLLDCLCLCRKEGWPKGAITRSYEAVSILVRRQYIESRSRIKISPNSPQQKSSPELRVFLGQLITLINKCLQTFKDSQEQYRNVQINEQSPLAMETKAKQKAYQLFISQQHQDKRFRTLYNTTLQKLKTEIKTYRKQQEYDQTESTKQIQKLSQKQISKAKSQESPEAKPIANSSILQNKKKSKKSITMGSIMQLIINETNNLFQFCRQLGIVHAPNFHPDYALYSIQSLLCYNILPEIFSLYKKDLETHCQKFHENSEYICKNLTSKQYFDYLQIRPKFKLQSSPQPYNLAINALRELETSLTLRQILLCMQKTFSLIKVCCLYEHDGKLDISSMDDILPVMIYVVAHAQVTDFPVYVKIIDDYVRIKGVFELEERVITTLYVATEDISKKVPKIESN